MYSVCIRPVVIVFEELYGTVKFRHKNQTTFNDLSAIKDHLSWVPKQP